MSSLHCCTPHSQLQMSKYREMSPALHMRRRGRPCSATFLKFKNAFLSHHHHHPKNAFKSNPPFSILNPGTNRVRRRQRNKPRDQYPTTRTASCASSGHAHETKSIPRPATTSPEPCGPPPQPLAPADSRRRAEQRPCRDHRRIHPHCDPRTPAGGDDPRPHAGRDCIPPPSPALLRSARGPERRQRGREGARVRRPTLLASIVGGSRSTTAGERPPVPT